MRRTILTTLTLLAVSTTGCSSIGGTWISKNAADTPKSPIGRATFASDGTFTCEADYGPKAGMKASSGTYSYDQWKKRLSVESDGKKRDYDCDISGDQMTLSNPGGLDPKAKAPQTKYMMTRMKGKSMWSMGS